MMGAPVLTIRNLGISLVSQDPARSLVEDVSLDVRCGETVCIVGESGSGKSLTSLAVMGLLPKRELGIVSGTITLDGEDLRLASDRRLRRLRATTMSMIFQEPMTALNPVVTVGRQIEEVLRNHTRLDRHTRRSRVCEMLERVHLSDVKRIYSSFPHQLSGGQRQRVMIAMALILRPKLLIADEPTTALDVTTQKQILSLIEELQREQGTGVLFITHDMGVVSEIADQVVVMQKGRLIESGATSKILREPADEYTRTLLRSVPSLAPLRNGQGTPAPAVLEIAGLAKSYGGRGFFGSQGGVTAAQDVSFSLGRGRTLGVVGESGSGKSTVARCIVRLIDPSAGIIKVAGQDIARLERAALRPHRKRIQIVFQDPYRSLNPRRTVGESMIEGPLNFGVSRQEALRKARNLLGLVGLPDDVISRYPHQFSGGQRQRIAIARALAMEPDVLVADEAVSALDVSVQAQVLRLLDEIQRRLGIAMVFITHDLRVAAQICDDIMVMKSGRVVEYAPAAEILSSPRDPYTQALFEATPGRDWDFPNFRPFRPQACNGSTHDPAAPKILPQRFTMPTRPA